MISKKWKHVIKSLIRDAQHAGFTSVVEAQGFVRWELPDEVFGKCSHQEINEMVSSIVMKGCLHK